MRKPQYNPRGTMSTQPPPSPETLEYTKSAERYNEIYKALWQNFSYMALLSGAILTFGRDALGVSVAGCFACVPLLVWYWATYEPLNKYGVLVEQHLVALEKPLKFKLYTNLYQVRFPDRPMDVRAALPDRRWTIGAALLCLGAFWLAFFSPPVLPALVVASGALTLVYLLIALHQEKAGGLHVRKSIRLCAVLLHATFAVLLGTWYGQGAIPSDEKTVSFRLKAGELSLDLKGSPQQLLAVLETLVLDPSARSTLTGTAPKSPNRAATKP